MEVDFVEVFVEVDFVGCVSCGAGECKHEVRDGSCLRVQNTKAAGIQAELCDEEGVMREELDTNDVR